MPSWTVSAAVFGFSNDEEAFIAILEGVPAMWGGTFNAATGDLRLFGEVEAANEAAAIAAGQEIALKALSQDPHGHALVITAQPTADLLKN